MVGSQAANAIAHDFRTSAGTGEWSLNEFREMESNEDENRRHRRRSYVESFKRDALRLVSEQKGSFKAAAVNVSEQSYGPGTRSS